jgi:KRAB domain-containing zinc finger protein
MTEQQATHHHHKIKDEWIKASNNEIYGKPKEEDCKVKIIEQVVICPKKSAKKPETKKCGICEKSFADGAFEEHEKTHENSFFECPEEGCNKQFKRKSSLRKHLYFHKGKFKYSCKDCSETFVDRVKYEIHVASKHKKIERVFECPECKKTFSSSDYLRKHQITHKDEFKYACKTCDQKFKWLTSLQSHVLIHTQNKATLQCTECLKCFFNARTLDRHKKIHEFVKYQCSICLTISSKRRDNILRHIRHLHQEIPKSEVIKHVKVIEEIQTNVEHIEIEEQQVEEIEIDDDDDSNVLIIDESIHEIQEEPEEPIEPPIIISNRVNVIQSIGNPNKNVIEKLPEIQEPPKPQEEPHEIQLPPKKKATAKYNPIEQYRKIFGLDEPNETEQASIEESQVFPDHWRKRTSQNFLFRK